MKKVKHRLKLRPKAPRPVSPVLEYLKVAAPYVGLLWNMVHNGHN